MSDSRAGRLYSGRNMDSSTDPTSDAGSQKPAASERAAIPHDLYCQECGYNLRGLTSDRCPECGRSLEGIRVTISRIPWAHRKEIGRFRAYWKTIWLATFCHPRFCDELARPVSYRDSQSFRWVTIAHAYLPILLVTAGVYLFTADNPFTGEWYGVGFGAASQMGVFLGCVLVFLIAATGVPSYFFRPRDLPVELQNRAIALSYYASGPLAITVLPVVAASGSWLTWDTTFSLGLAAFTIAVLLVEWVVWCLDVGRLAARLAPQKRWRIPWVSGCVLSLWIGLGVLSFWVVPLLVLIMAGLVLSLV